MHFQPSHWGFGVCHHSPSLPNHNALPRPKLQQHSLLQRGFSCTWHCIIQLKVCANRIAGYSGIGNHRAFTQAFRSSDIAEGMQCVVRMSWVAALAVLVSRTTTCQIIRQLLPSALNIQQNVINRWQFDYLVIIHVKLQELLLAIFHHGRQLLQIIYWFPIERTNLYIIKKKGDNTIKGTLLCTAKKRMLSLLHALENGM